MKDTMTVKQMIDTLSQFNENYLVYISGGQDERGDWATLNVGEDDEDVDWNYGKTLLEYEN